MLILRPSGCSRLRRVVVLLALLATSVSIPAQPTGTPANGSSSPSNGSFTANTGAALASFIDRLPELLDFDVGLPTFAPPGAVRFYAHPRFGDLLHEDYFRLPLGARIKLNQNIDVRTELGTYFTHGFGEDVGNGLYQARLGLSTERAVSPETGWSTGVEFVTPLSRPPYEITDGLRHTRPFVTVTQRLGSRWNLVGFATLSADLIDHTSLLPNYRENQLRENSMMLTLGLAREWRRMHLILRVFEANTAPLSDTSENVFGFRPSIGIPLLRRPDGSPRATATFEGRAVWGPDGFETGVTTRVRVDLRYRPGRPRQ